MKEKQDCRTSTEAELSFSQEQMKGSSLSGKGACTPMVGKGEKGTFGKERFTKSQ